MKRLIALGVLLLTLATTKAAEPTYDEPHRPQFHFTPAKNWMNDPNGMVYFDGEYHLFYQYNPFGDKWGHMSWGHAVSRDMVHWEHLPVALFEENDVMIFSGSAVIDWKNTSGFGQGGEPPMIAIYTGHYTKKPLQNQQIAYSNDRGRTWTKYAGNPVLDIGEADFRDPKVIWHEESKRWIMTVAWPAHHKVRFYSSPNLREWKHLSDFGPAGSTGGIWECPDLFPLPVEGSRQRRWVLVVNLNPGGPAGGSACQYFVGEFDGAHFVLDSSYPKPQPEYMPAGKVLADFEGGNYGEWQASGNAFGPSPAGGKIGGQQVVAGFHGAGLVNTFRDGDQSQGTLTSPEFEISHQHINFLIGGGNHAERTCMNLLVDGKVVRTATGNAAERLAWKSWNVSDLRGRKGRVEIVDRHSGGWGHINVDQIMLADEPARPAATPALWADFAPDYYAAVSWSDVPPRDGRRLWLGWMSDWRYAGDVPTSPWRSAMSIPRELVLRKTSEGLRLVQKPVRELQSLREEKHRLRNADVAKANDWLKSKNIAGPLWEINLEMEPGNSGGALDLSLLRGADEQTIIRCDPKAKLLTLDRTKSGRMDFHGAFPGAYEAPLPIEGGQVKLRMFIDTSSVEVFANGGESVMTALVFPRSGNQPFELSGASDWRIRSLEVWKLRPAVPIRSAAR